MGDLENHPLFDPQVKISGIDEEKEIQKVQLEAEVAKGLSTDQKEVSGASGGDCDLTGFSLFEEQLAEEKPKSEFAVTNTCVHSFSEVTFPIFLSVHFAFSRYSGEGLWAGQAQFWIQPEAMDGQVAQAVHHWLGAETPAKKPATRVP